MRRFCLFLLLACGGHVTAHAGNQKEEQLADPVRLALAQAVADSRPPKPQFNTIEERIAYLDWLGEMSERLRDKLPDRQGRIELLESVWYESRRAGLDSALVLGLIQVESAFRKYAISSAGATGYMQVMPFWTRAIGDGDRRKLFHMRSNLRYGCSVLRLYLDQEGGDYFMALGKYNGSRGQEGYPNAVLNAWKKWEYKKREGINTESVMR
ncbi:lytic transglycosylase domain-containing protein [Herbaspirillum sp. RV1423]|uniref:lytic transglycosylase domain-containing protein n=1 Tax=Herbaspirillum sp. RV1423 TaxID=1443993 RepID=UPI0004AD5925|nr:lytic transglycosylase domain-containing protein [Herbaspirillum sp. RV1423]